MAIMKVRAIAIRAIAIAEDTGRAKRFIQDTANIHRHQLAGLIAPPTSP